MNSRVLKVVVASLGSGGDGGAETEEGRLFIPYAAPGDTLRVRLPEKVSGTLRAEIVDDVNPQSNRHGAA